MYCITATLNCVYLDVYSSTVKSGSILLQYVNYQKNNKTIIYRMLDVANQVDWVSFMSYVNVY